MIIIVNKKAVENRQGYEEYPTDSFNKQPNKKEALIDAD